MSKVYDYSLKWFHEVAPRDYYNENDFERAISLSLNIFFPEFLSFPFKQKLRNNATLKKNAADLCMIKKDYSEWYVIEVELGEHSFKEVVAQIETFKNCTYTSLHANYIFERGKSGLDLIKLISLISNSPPQLMIIVNEHMLGWKDDLNKLQCKMCIFQIYNNYEGRKLFRIAGDHPIIYTDFCQCKYEKQLPYTIKVLNYDFLNGYGIYDGASFWIEYNGINSMWLRQTVGDEVFLICNSNNPPLDPLSSRYRLNYNKLKTKNNNLRVLFNNIFKFNRQNIVPKNSSVFCFSKD